MAIREPTFQVSINIHDEKVAIQTLVSHIGAGFLIVVYRNPTLRTTIRAATVVRMAIREPTFQVGINIHDEKVAIQALVSHCANRTFLCVLCFGTVLPGFGERFPVEGSDGVRSRCPGGLG
jgi:hypothetical protein